MRRGFLKGLLLGGLLVLVVGCGGRKYTAKIKPVPLDPYYKELYYGQRPYIVKGKTYYPLLSAKGYVEEGLASWYGPKFHGRPTASGEPFNMYAFTAAHKILPLGTYVLVTNLENGRSVVVRINDRGPFVPGRILDLSYAAARALDMVKKGIVSVRIVALAEGKKTSRGLVFFHLPKLKKGEYYLQVGSFKNYARAVKLRHRLSRRFPTVLIEPFRKGGHIFYRVKIFLGYELDRARRLASSLKKEFPYAFLISK